MASKKFPLLIFVFVLLIVIAGIATLAFHRAQKQQEMTYQQNAPQVTPTGSSTSTSNAQLDQDSQNVDNNLNSLNQDLNNVDSSMNDQSTNLQ